ncbi:hypothetical protein [Pseudactinotalea sp.]|uniref:hypothetical protein n=1 Tax=Pseudactinotalea sp. TaxID=1926260 RepID=UPI003B3B4BC0
MLWTGVHRRTPVDNQGQEALLAEVVVDVVLLESVLVDSFEPALVEVLDSDDDEEDEDEESVLLPRASLR